MHRQGTPATMQDDPRYDDVVAEVRDLLAERAAQAAAAGVGEVWIDPGIGFGKTVDHNLELLAGLDALVATGHPVLVGHQPQGVPRRPGRRAGRRPGPGGRPAARIAGHGHVGPPAGGGYGPGARRGGHRAGRAPGRSARSDGPGAAGSMPDTEVGS